MKSTPRPRGFVSRDRVVGIQFGVLNPDDMTKRSVVEVKTPTTYENGKTIVGGLFDPRMGVLENRVPCPTDGQTNLTCPGYFGHYRTAMPVYNIGFIGIIRKILMCTCVRCGKVYIGKDSPEGEAILALPMKKRFAEVYAQSSKNAMCGSSTGDGCGALRPKAILKEGVANLVAEYKAEDGTKTRSPLTVVHVRDILRRINDDDLRFMGIDPRWARPDWMVTDIVPISPPYIRPSVKFDNNQRSEDDITYKYLDIIKADQTLRAKIKGGADAEIIHDWWMLLQYHFATLIDNDLPDAPASVHRLGRPLKSIVQRIVGKEGRIRGNLMGKRVDFSARTVITGDPNLSIRQVGVPLKIAMNLTVPEMVTERNRVFLQKCVENGPDTYPGAKSIQLSRDGNTYSLKVLSRRRIELSIGDIVHRHMTDGDPVLFNRQPSLHRPSMMCHRTKVLPYNTFRLNVMDTPPYNADFDGDEMNMHLPQSLEAMTELRMLAAVPNQIVIAKNNSPVVQAVQDIVLGINRMTMNKLVASRPEDARDPNKIHIRDRDAMNIMMGIRGYRGALPPPTVRDEKGHFWSGKDLFHAILPGVFVDEKGESSRTIITPERYENRDGADAPIDKKVLNKGTHGIIHQVFTDKGPDACSDFLDNLQNLIVLFLVQTGFSVGLSDLIADPKTEAQILNVIRDKKEEVAKMARSIHTGEFENKTSRTNHDVFEERVNGVLNTAIRDAGKIGLESLSWDNRMTNMVKSGSKGKPLNVSQMVACLGQVNVDGTRIPYGYEGRTLPHFQRYDDSPEARGFVENSFVRGLTPTEFFFHAQSGREGLIDTAVKTSATGYVQRQMVKSMEDLKVHYDYSVRTANGSVVQMVYGEDGMDSTRILSVRLPSLTQSVLEIYQTHAFREDDPFDQYLLEDALAKTKRDMPEVLRLSREHAEKIVADRDSILEGVGDKVSSVNYSIPFDRIIREVTHSMRGDLAVATNLDPLTVFNEIEKLERETRVIPVFGGNGTMMALARVYLSPRVLIREQRVTHAQLEMIMLRIRTHFEKSLVHPGEMVGVIAAQSIGEPATQMSLLRSEKVRIVSVTKSHDDDDIVQCENVEIGEFCDKMIHQNPKTTRSTGHEDSVETDIVNEDKKYYIVGVDSSSERTYWNPISHVSRHPVNGKLVRVRTRSGREVVTTESHSHLRRAEDQTVQPIRGGDLQLGMRIPVAYTYDIPFERNTYQHAGETHSLTPDLGWFIGAYLAEGSLNGQAVIITNQSDVFVNRCSKITKFYDTDIKTVTRDGEYGPSVSTFIHSLSLRNLLRDTCGTGSFKKKIPGFVFIAPALFRASLLRALIDGDGNMICDDDHHSIRICSRSHQLMKDTLALLATFGITGTIHMRIVHDKSLWEVAILSKYSKLYREHIGSDLHTDILNELVNYSEKTSSGDIIDKIPNVGHIIAKCGQTLQLPGQSRTYGRWMKKESIGRKTLDKYVDIFESHKYSDILCNEIDILQRAANSSVIWDEIVELDVYTPPQTEYVYDFTVPGNQTFMTDEGVIVHNTLNTFHAAGVSEKSNVVRGVPRLNEILHLSKNLKGPSITVYLPGDDRHKRESADLIRKNIMRTRVRDVLRNVKIVYDPRSYASLPEEDMLTEKHWKLYMIINPEEMHERGITMEDLHISIARGLGGKINSVRIDTTDTNAGELRITLSLYTDNEVSDDSTGDAVRLLRDLETMVTDKIVVRGIRGIKHAVIRKTGDAMTRVNHEYSKESEYVVDTVGTNLLEILGQPGVDTTRTSSNHILEIFEVLGIDAARNAIIRELVDVFEGSYINYHHLSLLADKMTCRGKPTSVDRHGVNKSDAGPLAKASFEETDTMLLKAAQTGELDPVTGVTSNIMFGQPIPGGTGMSQVLLDESMFEKTFRKPRETADRKAEREMAAEAEQKAQYCETRDVRLQPMVTDSKSAVAWMDEDDLF